MHGSAGVPTLTGLKYWLTEEKTHCVAAAEPTLLSTLYALAMVAGCTMPAGTVAWVVTSEPSIVTVTVSAGRDGRAPGSASC
jgi:hypothetical protein